MTLPDAWMTWLFVRYGKSEGKPTQEGLLLDVEASLRALRENPKFGVDPKKIFLFGRSLGGAVALGAAERYPDQVSLYYLPGITGNGKARQAIYVPGNGYAMPYDGTCLMMDISIFRKVGICRITWLCYVCRPGESRPKIRTDL